MTPLTVHTIPLRAIETVPLLHLRQHGPVPPLLVDSLAASMAGPEGLVHPITVMALAQPTTFGRTYVLVAGHRRLAAAQLLGWAQIPARVLPPADLNAPATRLQLLAMALAENRERQALHPEDRRQAVRLLQALYAEVYPPQAPQRSEKAQEEDTPPSFTRWAAATTHIPLNTIRRDLRQAVLAATAGLPPAAIPVATRLQQVTTLAQQLVASLEACVPSLAGAEVPLSLRIALQQTLEQVQVRTSLVLTHVGTVTEETVDAPSP